MGRRLINRQYKLGSRAPSMQVLTGDSGIANLSNAVTVNSTAVSASVVAYGNDATALTFPLQVGGISLPIAGSGTSPSLNQPAPGNGSSDYMVKGGAGEYYQAGDTTTGNISTNDALFRLAFFNGGTSSVVASKRVSGVGWTIGISSNKLYCSIEDSSGSSIVVSATLSAGQFYFGDIWLDRSGSAQIYVNGEASGAAANISGRSLTLDSATALTMLATSSGTSLSNSGIVYFGMWQSAAWFSTHLNATESAEALQKWSGIYPTKASGTAAPTYSRACSAYATKWNGTSYDLINCSAGLPRVDYVLDDSGTPFKGMLIEPQQTNLLTYSNDIDDVSWGKSKMTIDTAETKQTPDSNIFYQGLVSTAESGVHYVAGDVITSAGNHCFSAIVQKGCTDWIMMYSVSSTATAYFNLALSTVGTLTGGVSSGILDLGSDNCLIWMVDTLGVGYNNMRIYLSDADGSVSFTGDGSSVCTYVAFLQVETGNKPTSRIYTAGASATRLADDLQYNGDNVTAGQGTVKAEVLVDAHTPAAELSIAALSDGGSTDEMVRSYVDTGTQVPIFNAVDSTVAQWTITGSTDVIDGDIHTVKLPYESNDAKQYVDNAVDGTPDTSCTVPTGIDEIDIGQDTSSANQLNGRIRNFRIYGFASSDV